ncbi:hypothetical protein MUP79_10225 [Candidatus Bathyarchaeota archaeon]|nr:hypothetical protein [Candidatus Bathyarchaeota archaeon]
MSLDLHKTLLDEKIARAKELGEPADATLLLKLITNPNLSVDDRKLLSKFIEDTNTRMGFALLDRALADGTLTDAEWLDLQAKGLTPMGISTTLMAHYSRKDKSTEPDEDLVVITDPEEPIYAIKEHVLEKFGVLLLSPQQAIELLEKRKEKKDDIKVLF